MPRLISKDRPGQTLVEFALILPVFVLLLVGLFDFGRAIYAYNTVSNAAREATRVAIVNQTEADIKAEAVKMGVSLDLTGADVTVSYVNANLSAGAPCNASPRQNGCIVQVVVTYQYTAATPIISNLVGTLNLSSTARMPIERSFP